MRAHRRIRAWQQLLRRIQSVAWRAYGLLITGVFGVGVMLGTSSCTLLQTDAHVPSRWLGNSRPAQRIAQVELDGRPVYAVCADAECPAVTPKTIASLADSAADPAAPSAEPTSPDSVQPAAAPAVEDLAEQREAEPVAAQTAVVTFAFGQALLSRQGRSTLDAVADAAQAADRIVITGRTDSVGSERVNQRLALARAGAVRSYLRARLPQAAAELVVDARGKRCYVASNASAEGRARNRRSEVLIHPDVDSLGPCLLGHHRVPVSEGERSQSINPVQPLSE